ncbi:MAG TPA: GNAT family N-acetyltransferase [Rhodocyclaceae bacterium]|nr:GNAT family N-acetyltransferase [Rhodocyclaceae bacterium]
MDMRPWQLAPISAFAELAPAWDGLNRAMGGLPILESRFLRPALEQFADGCERIFWHGSAEAPDCMCILRPKTGLSWESFQPSQMPLGPFLLKPGADFPGLVAGLLRRLPGFPLGLGLSQHDPSAIPRPLAGGALRTMDYIQTASLPIRGSFDAYWDARGKNLRQNMRKQRKQLAADHIQTRLELITDPGRVGWAIEAYARLEVAGWKSGVGTAVAGDSAQGRFYRRMLEQFCSVGCGRIYCYWFDDRLAAMDLCVAGGGALVILKTSYDESLAKSLSPAFLMREESFRLMFEQGEFDRVEFYGRVMNWHLRWTDQLRTLYHANAYRHSGVALARDWFERRRGQARRQEAAVLVP